MDYGTKWYTILWFNGVIHTECANINEVKPEQ